MVKLQEYNWKPHAPIPLLEKGTEYQDDTKLLGIEIETELCRKDTPAYLKIHEKFFKDEEFRAELRDTNTRNAEKTVYAIQDLARTLAATKFYVKRDGSLRDGCEIVSHPFTLGWLEENAKSVRALLRKAIALGFNSYDTGTCGMHVHLSKSHFTGVMHLLRFYTFFQENAAFFHALSRRSTSSTAEYAYFLKDPTDHFFQNFARGMGKLNHHEAIELRHANTVEVRIFRGTLNFESIRTYCYLLTHLVEYTASEFLLRLTLDGFKKYLLTIKSKARVAKVLKLISKGEKVFDKSFEPLIKKQGTLDARGKQKGLDLHRDIAIPNSRWSAKDDFPGLGLAPKKEDSCFRADKYFGDETPPEGAHTLIATYHADLPTVLLGLDAIKVFFKSIYGSKIPRDIIMPATYFGPSAALITGYLESPARDTLYYPRTRVPFQNGCYIPAIDIHNKMHAIIEEMFRIQRDEPIDILKKTFLVGREIYVGLIVTGLRGMETADFCIDPDKIERWNIRIHGDELSQKVEIRNEWYNKNLIRVRLASFVNAGHRERIYQLPCVLKDTESQTRLLRTKGFERMERAARLQIDVGRLNKAFFFAMPPPRDREMQFVDDDIMDDNVEER